ISQWKQQTMTRASLLYKSDVFFNHVRHSGIFLSQLRYSGTVPYLFCGNDGLCGKRLARLKIHNINITIVSDVYYLKPMSRYPLAKMDFATELFSAQQRMKRQRRCKN
ncbi:hypothetical protein LZ653_21495, partial [Hafnia paralvei]|uniref:hypothetical protein n=1 Tax=Hafnia paralvei TaxID=546367 RepID=UPI001F2A8534